MDAWAQLFINSGAVVVVVSAFAYLLRVYLPKLIDDFRKDSNQAREAFQADIANQRKDFSATLDRMADSFQVSLDKQRSDFLAHNAEQRKDALDALDKFSRRFGKD